MKKATINLETLTCPSCATKIEAATKAINGVDDDSIKVLFNSSRVRLDFDENITNIEEIEKNINDIGYEVIKTKVR